MWVENAMENMSKKQTNKTETVTGKTKIMKLPKGSTLQYNTAFIAVWGGEELGEETWIR